MSGDLRWSQEQFDAHMAKFHPGKPVEACYAAAKPEPKHKSILPKARKMNATESAYAAMLEQSKRFGAIFDYRHEGMTLLLANDTRYIPDFVVSLPSLKTSFKEIRFVEVKREWKTKAGKKPTGRPHIEDDSRVKMAVAAEQFKHFATFWLAWLDVNGEWHEEQIHT